jgi:hypothetical protein
VELAHLDGQGIAVHEIPGIAAQLACDVGDEARRAVQRERFATAQGDAEHAVEADEVVHVRVGDEDLGRAQEPGRAQGRVVAQIEQEGAARPADLDVETRITEGIVHEIR